MTQTSIIDALERRTDQAVYAAGSFADQDWLREARAVVALLCKRGQDFTTDDVWNLLEHSGLKTHEPRALGAIIRELVKGRKIESTGTYKKSLRKECHRRPLAVWRPRNNRMPDDWADMKAQAQDGDNTRISAVD